LKQDIQTAALFDLDGVLVDTEGQYTDFWDGVREIDFPAQLDFATRIKGSTLKQIFATYYPNNKERAQEIEKQLQDFEATMDFQFIAGVSEFLPSLHAYNIPCAIVTSSNKAKMQNLERKHPEFLALFDHIFTAENSIRSKPAPDCYIFAANSFNVPPEQCYVFEDSTNGLTAARDSKANVIGVATWLPEEVIAPYCQYVLKDFTGFTAEKMLNIKRLRQCKNI